MSDVVLVTGMTGFIAQHCAVRLLEDGYQVRGTARSESRREEIVAILRPHLSAAAKERLEKLEIVAADLTNDEGWAGAMDGCRYVLHVASPLPAEPPADEDEVIVPARDGARRVIRAASQAGVDRAVLTSSTSAVFYGVTRDRVFTEDDWSNVDGPNIGPYEKSKTIAERAAWDLVAELGQDACELAVVNPGLVLGPLLSAHSSTSGELVRLLIDREMPAVPNVQFAIVDVRDVAAAHVRAMVEPHAAGERFIVAGDSHSMREVAAILAHLSSRGYRIPTRNLPSPLMRFLARFDKGLRLALNDLDVPQDVDSTKAQTVLGYRPRPVTETVRATADSMTEFGVTKPPPRRVA